MRVIRKVPGRPQMLVSWPGGSVTRMIPEPSWLTVAAAAAGKQTAHASAPTTVMNFRRDISPPLVEGRERPISAFQRAHNPHSAGCKVLLGGRGGGNADPVAGPCGVVGRSASSRARRAEAAHAAGAAGAPARRHGVARPRRRGALG